MARGQRILVLCMKHTCFLSFHHWLSFSKNWGQERIYGQHLSLAVPHKPQAQKSRGSCTHQGSPWVDSAGPRAPVEHKAQHFPTGRVSWKDTELASAPPAR